jgi:hypothetical protein
MTFTADDFWLLLRTLGGIALVLLFLRWYEPRMIYYPNVPTRRIERMPDSEGFAFEAVTLTAKDSVKLCAWFLPAARVEETEPPTVLLFHGNAGNISHGIAKYRVLLDLGLNVFVLDYRGYGDSEGQPGEQGMYRDADAAYTYLTGERGIASQNILLRRISRKRRRRRPGVTCPRGRCRSGVRVHIVCGCRSANFLVPARSYPASGAQPLRLALQDRADQHALAPAA